MPPRYSYWTIVAGGLPTAFRAVKRDELLPTFARLREKQPDAVLKWFARGRLWESPDQAREALKTEAPGQRQLARARGRDWRPGGEHRDPRQKFIDAQKKLNAERRQERWERKNPDGAASRGERTRNQGYRGPKNTPRPSPFERPGAPGGGERRDPRQKFIDTQKAPNAQRRQERWERKNPDGAAWRGERAHSQGNRGPKNTSRPSGFGRAGAPGGERRRPPKSAQGSPHPDSGSNASGRPSTRPFGKRPIPRGGSRPRGPAGPPPSKRRKP